MFVVRLFAKFGYQVVPAVCATVISAVVLSALQLTAGSSATPRVGSDDTVYIDVLPRINREPQAPVTAKVQPPVVEEAALAPAPPPARQDAAAPPTGRDRARTPVAARSEPAVAAKIEPAGKPEPAPLAPPMSIVNAEAPPQPQAEPHRVFGVAVPTPVTRVGGAVVEVAKVPVKVADAVVARPAVWVGEKIVQGVGGIAGWIIPGR
jgi:hypothetical protein